eukprot:9605396-Heterocapsa_arctica.AAC.1
MSVLAPTDVAVAAKVSRPSLKYFTWRAMTRALTTPVAFLRWSNHRQSTTSVPGTFLSDSSESRAMWKPSSEFRSFSIA